MSLFRSIGRGDDPPPPLALSLALLSALSFDGGSAHMLRLLCEARFEFLCTYLWLLTMSRLIRGKEARCYLFFFTVFCIKCVLFPSKMQLYKRAPQRTDAEKGFAMLWYYINNGQQQDLSNSGRQRNNYWGLARCGCVHGLTIIEGGLGVLRKHRCHIIDSLAPGKQGTLLATKII